MCATGSEKISIKIYFLKKQKLETYTLDLFCEPM